MSPMTATETRPARVWCLRPRHGDGRVQQSLWWLGAVLGAGGVLVALITVSALIVARAGGWHSSDFWVGQVADQTAAVAMAVATVGAIALGASRIVGGATGLKRVVFLLGTSASALAVAVVVWICVLIVVWPLTVGL